MKAQTEANEIGIMDIPSGPSCFIDFDAESINKDGEELCGDKVEYYRDDDGMILVLSDGLGSGVKANILATLTTKIVITMLKNGAEIEDVVDTVTKTLPVCNIRKIAYSTFSIIKVSSSGVAKIYEFDNPAVFYIRNGRIVKLQNDEIILNGKKIRQSSFQMQEGDTIVLVSDGAVHAGVEKTLNLGWQWDNIAQYLASIINDKTKIKSQYVTHDLLSFCNHLYCGRPGDDTTVVTLSYRMPEILTIFSGPPVNPESDKDVVRSLMLSDGKKIVCGGTAANIVSRELKREIRTTFELFDKKIPPVAYINGIDLVTEGVLTLRGAVERLRNYNDNNDTSFLDKRDGASLLATYIINCCTHICFLIGRAKNPAHQNPDFPEELSIKLNVIEALRKEALALHKIVKVCYY